MLTPFWRIGVGFGPLPDSGRTVIEETGEYVVERNVQRAREAYGVVIREETVEADVEETRKLWESMRKQAPG